jgi:signal transduction histidine kinase
MVVILLSAWLYWETYLFETLQKNTNSMLSVETLYNLTLRGFVIIGVGALLGLAISSLLTWLIIRQLSKVVDAMHRVQDGDLTARLSVWAQDEIGEVQAAYNTMVQGLVESKRNLLQNQQALEQLNTEKNRLLVELTNKEAELRNALNRAVAYQEDERKRISRELHDEIGQSLTSILIRLKNLQDVTDPKLINDRVNGILYITAQTIEEMRRLSMDLRPAALDNLGILPALRWCVQQSSQQNKDLEVLFVGPERMNRLPPEVEIVLYRIAQEGLNNAVRHSQAKHVEIKLEQNPHLIWLEVSDDGQGFDPNKLKRGLGLVGIRERVELVNGDYGIENQIGGGTRLWVEIPLTLDETTYAG